MKKVFCLLVLLVSITVIGCEPVPSQSKTRPIVPPVVEKPVPEVSAIVASAVELREEKLFLVTLEFKKEQLTLDFWAHLENDIAAEHQTIVVGERTFNEYQVGREISSKGDGFGFLFNGEIASYVVRVSAKKTESQYFWANKAGVQTEINKEQFDEALRQSQVGARHLLTIPFSGVVRTYVLDKSLSEYQFVEHQPLNRYFLTIEVKNSTFTLDLSKHIRNAANTHEIIIEVPAEVYDRITDAWDPRLNAGSLVMKGHLSSIQGKVIKKWTEVDPGYQVVKTADGQHMIVPK